MTRRLVFRPQAEAEILDAHDWYEERRAGLGATFTVAVELAVAGILERPLAHPRAHGEIRRALVRRFPYAIYFRVLQHEIFVVAVMHGRQHPRRWQSRR